MAPQPRWDFVLENGRAATMAGAAPYGAIEDVAIAIAGGKIAWIGPRADMPKGKARERVDLGGRWVTPGLIDCHTHLVYGGNRSHEFEQRLLGASYADIAKAGGGIASTVRATRAASEDELVASAERRLRPLLAEGVTTIEIKSGYGLDLETERRMLRAARRLGELHPVTVKTTCLAAHALPPEYAGRPDDYIDLVTGTIIPALAKEGLADAVDAFCENIAFTPAQTRRVFEAAEDARLPVKLHAEQLSDQNGAALAAEFNALSADHLEHANERGLNAMALGETVAVLLPGAFYALRETKLPPIDAMRRLGVKIAIATDSNPGTSPALSLLLMLGMASTFFRLSPEEGLRGVTVNAAQALGLLETHGTLEVGKAADIAIWDIERPAELCYWIGGNPIAGIMRDGAWTRPL